MNSHLDLDDLNFVRDIPTTRDDLEYLSRSVPIGENLLPRLDRLTQAVRSLGIRPGRETAEGWAPFELDGAS